MKLSINITTDETPGMIDMLLRDPIDRESLAAYVANLISAGGIGAEVTIAARQKIDLIMVHNGKPRKALPMFPDFDTVEVGAT